MKRLGYLNLTESKTWKYIQTLDLTVERISEILFSVRANLSTPSFTSYQTFEEMIEGLKHQRC